MSLQRRLTLFFVVIVIIPLALAGLLIQRVVGDEISERAVLGLGPALDASVTVYDNKVEIMDEQVGSSILQLRRFANVFNEAEPEAMNEYLQETLNAHPGIDFLAVVKEGVLLGFVSRPGEFVEGVPTPTATQILAGEPGANAGFARTSDIPVQAGVVTVGSVIGGFWIDESVLVGSSRDEIDLSAVANGRVIASTIDLKRPVRVRISGADVVETKLQEKVKAQATQLSESVALLASTPAAPIGSLTRAVFTSILALLALALIATTVLAYRLARPITRPLAELAEGARAIAEGRYDNRIRVRRGKEVGQLARAFNDMAERLELTITELSSYRTQLQRAVRRVGQTLRSTGDMKLILESIVDTAAEAVQADAAALWRFTQTREELYPAVGRGMDVDSIARVKVGEGIVGLVAERGTSVLLSGEDDGFKPARGEPSYPVVVAVPIYSQDRIAGVLVNYRRSPRRPFSHEDQETSLFLAEQGGVGIENVQLQEEAKRLSLTDGLTGVWNRRYLQMQFRQFMATATRFDRPFSVLMLDLDEFKSINDAYGHQRGDSILVEFSKRVDKVLREVDTFARYGGEEFTALLSETDLYGAMATADKILEAIRSEPFGGPGETPVHLTVSIGAAAYPMHGDNFRELVDAADRALYRAKQTGRDRACAADPELRIAK